MATPLDAAATTASPLAGIASGLNGAAVTARAEVLVAPGQPLETRQLPLPVLAPGEVLLRMRACTLCGSDLHTAHGRRPHVMPTILGHEIVGEVVAFGPGEPACDVLGRPLAIGELVTWSVCASCGTCDRCRRGLPQKCRSLVKYGHSGIDGRHALAGGLADHVHLVTGTAIVKLPAGLAATAAAPASCAVATAAAMLRTAGPVADRTVVVLGAGMVGLSVASLAAAAGARGVWMLDPQADRLARAAKVVPGIFPAVPPADPAATAAFVAGLGADDGADIVVEAGGAAAAVALAVELTATGGSCIFAGTVSPVGLVPIDPERIVRRQLSIRGVHNYLPADLVTAVDHLASPQGAGLAGLVGPEFPLSRANDAVAAAASPDHLRVVVVP
jgi:putative phosphonate catabolism associated alcohol dehydrogenase